MMKNSYDLSHGNSRVSQEIEAERTHSLAKEEDRYLSKLVTVCCGIYGLFLSVCGFIVPLTSALVHAEYTFSYYSEGYDIYLFFMSLIALLFLGCCLFRMSPSPSQQYTISEVEMLAMNSKNNQQSSNTSTNGDDILIVTNRNASQETISREESNGGHTSLVVRSQSRDSIYEAAIIRELTNPPAVTYNAEGVSFYVRLGAIVFATGTIVNSAINIADYFNYTLANCNSQVWVLAHILQLVFTLIQTVVIFRYHKAVINKHVPLAKFALTHLVATNVATWLATLVHETEHDFRHRAHEAQSHDTESHNGSHMMNTSDSLHDNITSTSCYSGQTMSEILSPYLSPCIVEYSLISATAIYCMFRNITMQYVQKMDYGVPASNRPSRLDNLIHKRQCRSSTDVNESNIAKSTLVKKAKHQRTCHKAGGGLAMGVIIVSLTITAVILFFIYLLRRHVISTATLIFVITNMSLLLIGLIAVIMAFVRIKKLKFIKKEEGFLDPILLIVTLVGVFGIQITILVAAGRTIGSNVVNVIPLSQSILSLTQATLQTIFILDGLTRGSDSHDHIHAKPGRRFITFLIFCNLSLWIVETFLVSQADSRGTLKTFYGTTAWVIIFHVFNPLVIFYRFHSSTCLADIWHNAYRIKED